MQQKLMVEGRLAPPPRSPSHTLHSIQSTTPVESSSVGNSQHSVSADSSTAGSPSPQFSVTPEPSSIPATLHESSSARISLKRDSLKQPSNEREEDHDAAAAAEEHKRNIVKERWQSVLRHPTFRGMVRQQVVIVS